MPTINPFLINLNIPKYQICLFGFVWYFNPIKVENDRLNSLAEAIQKVECLKSRRVFLFYSEKEKNELRRILSYFSPLVIDILYEILITFYVKYWDSRRTLLYRIKKELQNPDSIYRLVWRLFRSFGFKSLEDKRFQIFLDDPIVQHWAFQNMVADNKEKISEVESLQAFINPELFNKIKSGQEGISDEVMKKIDDITRYKTLMKKMEKK